MFTHRRSSRRSLGLGVAILNVSEVVDGVSWACGHCRSTRDDMTLQRFANQGHKQQTMFLVLGRNPTGYPSFHDCDSCVVSGEPGSMSSFMGIQLKYHLLLADNDQKHDAARGVLQMASLWFKVLSVQYLRTEKCWIREANPSAIHSKMKIHHYQSDLTNRF